MKTACKFLAVLVTLAMVAGAVAADSTKKAEKVRGRVTKVEKSGAKITLSDRSGSDGQEKEIVITTDDKTKVTVDGKDAKVKDIAVGMRVNAEVTDGLASSITARKAADTSQSGCTHPKGGPTRTG